MWSDAVSKAAQGKLEVNVRDCADFNLQCPERMRTLNLGAFDFALASRSSSPMSC
jgi:hypothetical protein